MAGMYLDALSFLEDEREAWRPYEALEALSDEQLTRPVDGAHGWSGRDLMGHLLAWIDVSLSSARELAVGEQSPTMARIDAEWDARGDALNDDLAAPWAALPLAELRDRFHQLPGELRGYLTVVPETRWVKHPTHLESFINETIEHYDDHLGDLRAILAAAAG
jgi:mycothiol maleylpyruvate isomerase-like protein